MMAVLLAIWAWVQTWPATFVGVLVGGLLTLFGVVLTNVINLKNLEKQLKHNREEKARERAFAFRQEIYAAASDAISAGLIVLVEAANLSIPHDQLVKDWRAKSSGVGKVHMVATEGTGIELMTFMRELNKTMLNATLRRAELTAMQGAIDNHIVQRDTLHAEAIKLLELMRHHNIEGTMDERRMKTLESNVAFLFKQRDEQETLRQTVVDELRPLHLTFFDYVQKESVRVSGLLLPLVASIRIELEMPINLDEYRKVMTGEPAVSKEQLEKIFGMKMPEHVV